MTNYKIQITNEAQITNIKIKNNHIFDIGHWSFDIHLSFVLCHLSSSKVSLFHG